MKQTTLGILLCQLSQVLVVQCVAVVPVFPWKEACWHGPHQSVLTHRQSGQGSSSSWAGSREEGFLSLLV